MPHDPKRIEAAARALAPFHFEENGLCVCATCAGGRDEAREQAAEILDAAYPEFSSDPPSAWLAPWEATEAMIEAMDGCDGHTAYDSNASGETHYDAARDAHPKDQT